MGSEVAFQNLINNHKNQPDLRPPEERLPIFLEGRSGAGVSMICQFTLPAARLTEAWIPFLDQSSPDHTYRLEGAKLRHTRHGCPKLGINLQRIMVSSPSNARPQMKLGPWIEENPITQYIWLDGMPLVDSSTTQLRSLQVQ